MDRTPRPDVSQTEAAARAAEAFETFRAALPRCLPDHGAGHRLAADILWSGYVPAEGLLIRPAI